MNLKSLILTSTFALGSVLNCASPRIQRLGSAEIKVDMGHDLREDVYQVCAQEGDTLDSIAHDFWLLGIAAPTSADLLHQYHQRQKFNDYNICSPKQRLPLGLTFEYHTYTPTPGVHFKL